MPATRRKRSSKKPKTPEEAPGQPAGRRGRPKGASVWSSKEDVALAKQVLESRPWEAGKDGGQIASAWDHLATELARADASFSRSGSSCRARLKKLLEMHRQKEQKDLRATGQGGFVDELSKMLTEIDTLLRDHTLSKKNKVDAAQNKLALERQAGAELRDAAMRGLVKRQGLSDVTECDGATAREKGGQRVERQSRSRSPSNSSSGDPMQVEKPVDKSKPNRRTVNRKLLESLETQQEITNQAIEEAKAYDQERHEELCSILNGVLNEVTKLTDVLVRDQEVRAQVDKAHHEQITSLVSLISSFVTKSS